METIHFIYGTDDFLVNEQSEKVYAKLSLTPEDPFSCEVIDGRGLVVADVESIKSRFIQAIQTPSLLGGTKTVWLKGMNFLADSVLGKSETAKKAAEQMIEAIKKVSPGISIILSASPADKRTKEFKAFSALGKTICVEELGENKDLRSIAQAKFKAEGGSISPDALEILLQKVGNNPRLLGNEIEKLCVYAEGEKITQDRVIELVADSREEDFFEVPEAFFSKDLTWTLAAIERYFFNNKDARPLLASMQNRGRLLIQLKAIGGSSHLKKLPEMPEGAEKNSFNLSSQNPWYLKRLEGSLSKFSLKELLGIQKSLTEYFESILGDTENQAKLFEKITLRHLA